MEKKLFNKFKLFSRSYNVYIGLRFFFLKRFCDKMIQGIQFKRERNVADIPQNRHFKNMTELNKRSMVYPFGIGIVIPHFPEKSAE